MAFVVTHRHSGFMSSHAQSMMRVGRLLMKKLRAHSNLTPQERANLHVSRMPIAVVTASLGGHPSSSGDSRR
jgi:hypothetical protein